MSGQACAAATGLQLGRASQKKPVVAFGEFHIDGEVVCLDKDGQSVFVDLMRRRKANAILYCFDLPCLNNEDLRNLPLVERKLRLRHLIRTSRNRSLLYASHMERYGVRLFHAICQQDCDGIVGKYRRGTYTNAPASWVKILNPNYSQMRGRDEMFGNVRDRNVRVSTAGVRA